MRDIFSVKFFREIHSFAKAISTARFLAFRAVKRFIASESDADFASSWHSGNPMTLSWRSGKNAESRCEKKRAAYSQGRDLNRASSDSERGH